MESFGTSKVDQKPPPLKSPLKLFSVIQVVLRLSVTALTLAATWTVLTSKQTVSVFGIQLVARYNYSPSFRFFAVANIIGCGFSFLSVFVAFILDKKADNPRNYFYMFLHDLIVMALLLSGCASATAVGYVGKYGESQSGWMPICDNVNKFCHKITASLIFSYFAVIFYFFLTILSANQSTKSIFKN